MKGDKKNPIEILPGADLPCPCGATHGDIQIFMTDEMRSGGTIQGDHDATWICKCGRRVPVRVRIHLGDEEKN